MADPDAPGVAVLVVDDETLVRMYATETLDDAAYQVYEARDGQEALTILEVRGDAIRALITDLAMPNLGGLDLARIVSTRWPEIGIVFTSGYEPPGFRNEMPARARCLAKPYQQAALVEAVEAVVREKASAGMPVALHSIPTLQSGQMHGAGGLAQPLPDKAE
jgi:CheY-like chemotaxis protein